MQKINTFLVLALLAVASVFMAGLISTISLQQAEAARCDRNLVAVCGVCVNANVIGTEFSQRCNP
jgi:Na+-transporting NADH:ubiquinone oxidoreductase subunit NqrC